MSHFPSYITFTVFRALRNISDALIFGTQFWDNHAHTLFINMNIYSLHCILVTIQFSNNKNRGVFLKGASKFWNLAKSAYQRITSSLTNRNTWHSKHYEISLMDRHSSHYFETTTHTTYLQIWRYEVCTVFWSPHNSRVIKIEEFFLKLLQSFGI